MEEFEQSYPDKPILEKKKVKNSFPLTVLSIAVFVWAFLTFVSSDWRFIAIVIMVLLIHELGHLLSMKAFKYKSVKMLFIPFLGALVQGEKDKYSQWQRAVVLILGPVPGILIGSFLMYWSGNHHDFWVMYAGLLFVIINVLNLLPIAPLDGGQLTQVMFFSRQELFQLVFAFISSLVLIFAGLYLSNWILIGFGFVLGIRVRSFQKLYQIRKTLKEEAVDYDKNYEDLSNKEYHKIRKVFLKYSPSANRIVNHAMADEHMVEELISNEVNNILETPTSKDLNLKWKLVFISIWMLSIMLSVWILLSEINNLHWFIDAFQTWR